MSVTIVSSMGNFFRAGTHWQTDLVATVRNAEMVLTDAELELANITWLRISDDEDGDLAWNIKHSTGSVGLTLHVDSGIDIPSVWGAGSSVGFKIIITLPDGGDVSTTYSIVN